MADNKTLVCCAGVDPESGKALASAAIPECRVAYGIWIDKSDWPGDSVMGITYEEFEQQFDRACKDWNNACGINLYIERDPAKAKCKVSFNDENGGTLAWSHLADGTCRNNKRQVYDIRRWDAHLCYLTILHELGHLIGLHHRSGNYVMNPSILTRLVGLTPNDIARGRNLYGPPLEMNPDPEPEPPKDPVIVEKQLVLKLGDEILYQETIYVARDEKPTTPPDDWGGGAW